MEKTNELYVLFALVEYHSTRPSFNLWMSNGVYNVFALVINFISNDWHPKHVTIGLFEVVKTTRQALAKSLTELLDKYGLRKNIITYLKAKGSHLNAMISALKFVVNCEFHGLEKNFQGTCFGHAFSKACQYDIIKEKNCKNLKYVSIKSTQSNL
jgi:hypothetical protein